MFASGKCFTLINPNLLVYPINLLLWIGQESSGVSTVHLRVVELERNGQFVAEENLRSSGAVLGHVVGTDVDCGGGSTCGSSLSQRPRHWRCRSSPRKQCFAGIFIRCGSVRGSSQSQLTMVHAITACRGLDWHGGSGGA